MALSQQVTDDISAAVSVLHLNSPSNPSASPSSQNNGQSAGESSSITPQTPLSPPPEAELYDLICVGFGPASLATAIAIHDTSPTNSRPKCLYLEKQSHFAWHSGMQIPGAKMQISFLKDLATPRQPTSTFTFLNYLQSVGRLHAFINLGTFLPSRKEFEAYLRWCAARFEADDQLRYGTEVLRVEPLSVDGRKVLSWDVTGRVSGRDFTWRAKHVVVALGGEAEVPESLREFDDNIYHSSQYIHQISQIARIPQQPGKRLSFGVIGGGQSAAEIFNDLWDRFPNADVKLIIKGSALRPSDDSPFVNEIFDPDRVSQIFSLPPELRATTITQDKSTNYSVVRLELLEQIYEKLYMQRLDEPDSTKWRCQIVPNRVISQASKIADDGRIRLRLVDSRTFDDDDSRPNENEDLLDIDYLFTATGYTHNAHESILAPISHLISSADETNETQGKFPVGRDYRVMFDEEKVDREKAGIWLLGCNETTHGLSDTLLSILAVRGGELAEGMFGKQLQSRQEREDGDCGGRNS